MAKLGMLDNEFLVNKDAFSSGQISSKIWLCEQLESLKHDQPKTIWIYGGWYSLSAFLLLSRNNMLIRQIRSFDIDPLCEPVANGLLENWVWQDWKFRAFTADCNKIDPTGDQYGHRPDIVINTSTEHFTSQEWYDRIPTGTLVVLQSNNMPHPDHHSCFGNIDDFERRYPLANIEYRDQLDFLYPTWKFSRYMIIGRKRPSSNHWLRFVSSH